jgi:hypothetical protein
MASTHRVSHLSYSPPRVRLLTACNRKKLYKKHFKEWGLEKNLKTDESIAMIKIRERRRLANKDTVFIRRGKPVEPGKLRRFEKRHKLTADGGADLLHDSQGTSCMSM